MARAGRPPTPIERKRRLGNPGHRPIPGTVVALSPVVMVPATPDATDGDDLVSRLLATAASAWIAEPDRLTTLVMVRDGWDERATLRADINKHGHSELLVSEKGSRLVRRPESVRLGELEKQITVWLSQLGLNPTDRSRLGVAEVKAKTRLEELRDRRETRGRSRAG